LDEDHGWYGGNNGTVAYTDRGGVLCTTEADFTISGQCPGEVVLTNQSSGNYLPAGPSYHWSWNGEVISTDVDLTHFAEAGNHTIKLEVFDGNCYAQKTINHIVGEETLDTTFVVICEGEPFEWEGTTYSQSTIDTREYVSQYGCDSTLVLHLTVNPTYEFNETHVMCQEEIYPWHGESYTQTGNYTKEYQTVNGCDSIYYLTLIVNPVYSFEIKDTICDGEIYSWHGVDYTQTGNYTKEYQTVNGCDSIYHLNLTVNPLPIEVAIIQMPVTGVLVDNQFGSVSLSTSQLGIKYWT
jgi:hypothetical protein